MQQHWTSSKTALTTKQWVHIDWWKTLYMNRRIWQPGTACRSQIAQVEYQGQTRYTRILGHKPLIDLAIHLIAFNIIGLIGVEIFSLRSILAQCSSWHRAAHWPWKGELRTWNLGQIFEIKLWMVVQYHIGWLFTAADCSKNLNIENRSSSCQRWSLHGFQILHFICYLFGRKLWLLLIQNHARHCFQAFVRHHLKWLCSAIRIWADTLLMDRSLI